MWKTIDGIRLMDCPQYHCRYQMRPGTLKEVDGEEMMVWFCHCGTWYWVPEDDIAEVRAWKHAYKQLS